MTIEPVIELGDLRAQPAEPQRPARPGRRGAVPRRPRLPRWLPPLAVGVLVLLGAAASVPQRPALVPLATVPYGTGAVSAIGTDTVFVDRRGTLAAYDLDSGALRWSAPAAAGSDGMLLAESAGVLLVDRSDPPVATVAFDTRTGRLLWRMAGQQPGALLPDERMSLLYTADGAQPGVVQAVDVRTGHTVWVWSRPGEVAYFGPWTDTPEQPPRLVFEYADRSVQVVDAATGTVVVQGNLPGVPPPGGSAGTEDRTALSVVGGLLLASAGDDSHRVLAFDLDTLTPQWTVTVPASWYFATGCGPVLCVFGGQSLTGLDPASGARRWFTRAWNNAATALPGDRLLVQTGDQTAQSAIVSATDLRPVLGLRDWDPFVDQQPGGPLLVARDLPTLWTWFALVDPGAPTPTIYPLGRAYGVLRQDCSARNGYLVCPTIHNVLQVWRYRR